MVLNAYRQIRGRQGSLDDLTSLGIEGLAVGSITFPTGKLIFLTNVSAVFLARGVGNYRSVVAGGMAINVCFIEVVSFEEKGLIERTCQRIGKAVTKVQSSRVSALPVFTKRPACEVSLVRINSYECDLRFREEQVQVPNSIGSACRANRASQCARNSSNTSLHDRTLAAPVSR